MKFIFPLEKDEFEKLKQIACGNYSDITVSLYDLGGLQHYSVYGYLENNIVMFQRLVRISQYCAIYRGYVISHTIEAITVVSKLEKEYYSTIKNIFEWTFTFYIHTDANN